MQQEKRGVKTRMRSPEGPSVASRNRVRSPEGPGTAARARVLSPDTPARSAASRTRVKSPEVGSSARPNRGRSPEGATMAKRPVAVKKAGASTAAKKVETPARKKTWSQDMRALSKRGKRSGAVPKAAPAKPKKTDEENLPSFMRPTMGSVMRQRSHKERRVYTKKKPAATRRAKVKIGKDGKKIRRTKSIRLSQSFRGLRRSGSVRSMTRMKSIKQLRRQITFGRSAMGGRLDEGPSRLADIAEENRSPSPFSDRRISQEHQQPPKLEVDLDITDSAMLRDLGAVVLPVASPCAKPSGETVAETPAASLEGLPTNQGFGEDITDDELCSDAETRESSSTSLLRRSRGVVRHRTSEDSNSKSPTPQFDEKMGEEREEEGVSNQGNPLATAGNVGEEGILTIGIDDLKEARPALEQRGTPIDEKEVAPESESDGEVAIPTVRLGSDDEGTAGDDDGEPIPITVPHSEGSSPLATPGSEGKDSPFVDAFGEGEGSPLVRTGRGDKEGSPFAGARAKEGSPILPAIQTVAVVNRGAPEKEDSTRLGGDAEKQSVKEKSKSKSPSPIIAEEVKPKVEVEIDAENDNYKNVSNKPRALPSDMLEGMSGLGGNDENKDKDLSGSVGEKKKALAPMRESVGSCEVNIVESMLDERESVPDVLGSRAEEEEEDIIMPPVRQDPMDGRKEESEEVPWTLEGVPSMVSSVGSERLLPVVTRTPSDVPQLLSQSSEIRGSFLRRAEEEQGLEGKSSMGSEGSTSDVAVLPSSLHQRSSSTISREKYSYLGECSKIVEESDHLEVVEESWQGVRHTTRGIAIPYVEPEIPYVASESRSRSKSETPRRQLGSKVRGFWWELGAGFVAGVLTAVWLAMAGGCDACESDNELEFQEIETVPLMVASAARPKSSEPNVPVSSPPICTGTRRDLQEEWLWHNA
ncbi:hypothetical protein BSKO_07743 [Bryopsis sp. KO-2023]|nr:hypothetical protein BSKO_07743 [Bryopsis sp. KO-2023]